jgi:hypothetical protein
VWLGCRRRQIDDRDELPAAKTKHQVTCVGGNARRFLSHLVKDTVCVVLTIYRPCSYSWIESNCLIEVD